MRSARTNFPYPSGIIRGSRLAIDPDDNRMAGPGALLSGKAADYLLGLLKGQAPPPEVTAPGERRVKGVRTKQAGREHGPAQPCR